MNTMKRLKLILTTSLFLICFLGIGQNVRTIYYDWDGNEVEIKEFADYYRVIQDGDNYPKIFRDYYVSGKPLRTGGKIIGLDTEGGYLLDGTLKEFFESGQLKAEKTFVKGIAEGKYTAYFENGEIESTCTYHEGKIDGVLIQYDEEGYRYEQMFREGKPETEWVYVYDKRGNMSRMNEDGTPYYTIPSIENCEQILSGGQLWKTYYDGSIDVSMQVHSIREFGKYYRVDIFIGNTSLSAIEFDPQNLQVQLRSNSGRKTSLKAVSENDYVNKIDKKMRSKAFWYSMAQGVAAASAGQSYSSTVYSNGVSSVTSQYSNANAVYAQQVANQNISAYNKSLANEMSTLAGGFLRKGIINPGEYLCGFVLFDNILDGDILVDLSLNNVTYPFEFTDVINEEGGSFSDIETVESVDFSLALSPMVLRYLDDGGSRSEISAYEATIISDLNAAQSTVLFSKDPSKYSLILEVVSADEDDGELRGWAFLYDNQTLEKIATTKVSGEGGRGSTFNLRFEKALHKAAKNLASKIGKGSKGVIKTDDYNFDGKTKFEIEQILRKAMTEAEKQMKKGEDEKARSVYLAIKDELEYTHKMEQFSEKMEQFKRIVNVTEE